jgi:hypothetical protein
MKVVFYDIGDKERVNNLKNSLEENSFQKILITAGDSWTNQLIETFGNEKSWVREYAKTKGYDLVIISAHGGSSATQTFINLINLLSNNEIQIDNIHTPFNSWFDSNRFEGKNLDVIVQWTSIIRDYSEMTGWYKPYTTASLPDLSTDKFKLEMYEEYITNIFNEKYFSYRVQMYSWQLQKYFEKWNIPYYFWMGFCDLVPESVVGTDMDIRKYLNKDRWFNLYDKPNNMSDYLYFLEKKELPNKLNTILSEGGNLGLSKTLSQKLKNLLNNNKQNTSLEDSLFLNDLHPSKKGNEEIVKVLLERI